MFEAEGKFEWGMLYLAAEVYVGARSNGEVYGGSKNYK